MPFTVTDATSTIRLPSHVQIIAAHQEQSTMLLNRVRLDQFAGFSGEFEADVDPFTALVGPNNGGKTTVLRAIKFATDAFRMYFSGNNPDRSQPQLSQIMGDWSISLKHCVHRIGVQDADVVFHGKNRNSYFSIALDFNYGPDIVTFTVKGLGNQDNLNLTLSQQGKRIGQERSPAHDELVTKLFDVRTEFIPSLGTISPEERELSFGKLQEELAKGRFASVWRNQLHWLNEGKPTEQFQRLSNLVQTQLGIQILPPRRTRADDPPNVILEFRERNIDLDIATGGGGLRTLISIAAVIELSNATLLLFDEPDAHLHSSLQRQVARILIEHVTPERQIIISTHAPDLIDELPIESVRWIDRESRRGERCDEAGRTLVRLGAVSANQALQTLRADVVLYFEGKPDRTVLIALMERLGMGSLAKRVRPALLKGFGDVAHLPGAMRIVKTLLPQKVAIAAVLDADYSATDPELQIEDQGDVLVLRLACKELENLLIIDTSTVFNAANRAAEARATAMNQQMCAPTHVEVDRKIDEMTCLPDVRNAIEDQWLFRWLEKKGGPRHPGDLTVAKQEFENRFGNPAWRRRSCPGGLVLTHLRQWLQSEPWAISLSMPQLVRSLEPTEDLRKLFTTLDQFVTKVTA